MPRPHPLTQIFIALWFSGLAIVSVKPAMLAVLLLLCAALLLIGKILTPMTLGRSLLRVLPLILMILLIQLLAVRKGTELCGLGSFVLYTQGLALGIALSLRITVILLAAKLLIRLTPMDFDAAFRTLRLPEEVGFMVSYAVHLLPGIATMLRDVNLLIRKRGIALRSLHVKQRIRLYGIIALRLVSELLQGSETRAIALELRGFRNGIKSSRLVTYRFSWIDPLIAATLIAGVVLLLNIQ